MNHRIFDKLIELRTAKTCPCEATICMPTVVFTGAHANVGWLITEGALCKFVQVVAVFYRRNKLRIKSLLLTGIDDIYRTNVMAHCGTKPIIIVVPEQANEACRFIVLLDKLRCTPYVGPHPMIRKSKNLPLAEYLGCRLVGAKNRMVSYNPYSLSKLCDSDLTAAITIRLCIITLDPAAEDLLNLLIKHVYTR